MHEAQKTPRPGKARLPHENPNKYTPQREIRYNAQKKKKERASRNALHIPHSKRTSADKNDKKKVTPLTVALSL